MDYTILSRKSDIRTQLHTHMLNHIHQGVISQRTLWDPKQEHLTLSESSHGCLLTHIDKYVSATEASWHGIPYRRRKRIPRILLCLLHSQHIFSVEVFLISVSIWQDIMPSSNFGRKAFISTSTSTLLTTFELIQGKILEAVTEVESTEEHYVVLLMACSYWLLSYITQDWLTRNRYFPIHNRLDLP